MNALAHEFDLAQATMLPTGVAGDNAQAQIAALKARWDALHDAAHAVAQLAQLAREDMDEASASLPERAYSAGGPRLDAVEHGISDLALVMQTGLTALLAATSQGKDASSAALTLWLEFHAGRKAIAALLEPAETSALQ
ncbi:hypothetical protein ACRAQ7_04755 [Erythrobacter sp. W53]|uniref:hypothetical protein n=1 Tax=Erythrobacter sp. W53 TaxID=3425947 RepID=UPI003D76A31E